MSKLKQRIVSSTLAMAMTVSMVTSAGAQASSTGFTDADKIKNTEAVNMLVSLNVISGLPDGSFAPTETVNRGEMAKMIYVVYNGGVDDGAVGYPSAGFTDTQGHWAEGYINAMAAVGSISGKSATSYAPDEDVTATECYKMLLGVIGYDQDKAGLVGSDWASNTVRLAMDSGLNEDITSNLSAGMARDDAAQAIYNCIDTQRVKLVDGEYVEYSNDDSNPTVGEKYMNLATAEGVYVGNDEASLDGSNISDGYIKIAQVEDGQETGSTLKIQSDADSTYLGQIVKVHYKTPRNSSDYVAYGLYPTDDTTIEPFNIVDDYDAGDLENADSADALVSYNGEMLSFTTADHGVEADTIDQIIDKGLLPSNATLSIINNDNLKDKEGKSSDYNSIAFVTMSTFSEISTHSGSTLSFTESIPTGDFTNLLDDENTSVETTRSFDLDDDDITYVLPADLDVDDKVMAWYDASCDTLTVELVEVVEGEVDGLKGSDIRISGEYYGYADNKKVSPFVTDFDTDGTKIKTGNDYALYMYNGFYIAAEKISGSNGTNNDYAIVDGAYDVGEEMRLKLLTADGSVTTYTVDEFLGDDVGDFSGTELEDTIALFDDSTGAESTLVTYETTSNGVNILAVDDTVTAHADYKIEDGFVVTEDTDSDFYNEGTGALEAAKYAEFADGSAAGGLGSKYLSAEADIFFYDGSDWDVYAYDQFDEDLTWDDLTGSAAPVVKAVEDGDGEIECLFIATDANAEYAPSGVSGMQYGYILDNTTDNGDYTEILMFTNGSEETYEFDGSTPTGITSHSIVAYTLSADGLIDDLHLVMDEDITDDRDFKGYTVGFGVITDVNGDRVKITEYNDFDEVDGTGTEVIGKTTDDSVLMTLDSGDQIATEDASLRKNNHTIFVINEDNEIEYMAIDVDGWFSNGADFNDANNIGN